jgi:hypothetical protein
VNNSSTTAAWQQQQQQVSTLGHQSKKILAYCHGRHFDVLLPWGKNPYFFNQKGSNNMVAHIYYTYRVSHYKRPLLFTAAPVVADNSNIRKLWIEV